MAIYHFSAQVISRSQGRSSVASAAYRSSEKLLDERTGELHDFTRKSDVLEKEMNILIKRFYGKNMIEINYFDFDSVLQKYCEMFNMDGWTIFVTPRSTETNL